MGESIGHYLVVSVDYGTTYTGISFAMSDYGEIDDIFTIDEWPKATFYDTPPTKTETAVKVPSQIAYAAKNPKLVKDAWGYQIKPSMTRCTWMKLLLDKNTLPTPYDDPDLQRDIDSSVFSLPEEKTAKCVTVDYLREVYEFAKMKISEKLDLAFEGINIHFWFTMPAIWGVEAQTKTVDAAKEAGFGIDREGDKIFTIKEPEAAAFAVLHATELGPESSVRKSDGVLICDCGGGTVDLSTYRVIATQPILKLREACPASGGKCGGTYIDRNLRSLMTKYFGEDFSSLDQSKTGPGSQFMTDFEQNKRIFGDPGKKLEIMRLFMDAPDSDRFDSVESHVILKNEDMKEIFDPVVNKVKELISTQVETARRKGTSITDLVLVGGFGGSPYLQREVRSWCGMERIKLRIPEDSWSAVSRGALLRGLDRATVDMRLSRFHFGIPVSHRFNSRIHSEEDAYDCPFNGKMAKGYVKWCVSRGDEVVEGAYESMSFNIVLGKTNRRFTVRLLSCTLPEAPDRDSHESLQHVGEIEADLSKVDLDKLDSRVVSGSTKVQLCFEIRILLGDALGTILFDIFAGGLRLGRASTKFRD